MEESKQSIKESIGQWTHCGPAETLPHEDCEATGGAAPVQVALLLDSIRGGVYTCFLKGFFFFHYSCNFEC